MRHVLDTHTLLWHLGNDPRLGANAKRIIENPEALLLVPVLVLAEAKHAADRKRVSVTFERVVEELAASPRLSVLPMDIHTVNHLSSKFDIHDSIIVAAALYAKEYFGEEIALLTKDKTITDSGLIPVIW